MAMSKAKARSVLSDMSASEVDRIEARKVLNLNVDGSEDSKADQTSSTDGATTEKAPAGTESGDQTKQADPASPLSQTGGLNNADASNTGPNVGGAASIDSQPNTGDSATLNKPSIIDSGAAAGAASAAVRDRFDNRDRPALDPQDRFINRSRLTGEVDSVSSVPEQGDTAASNGAHATQPYMDNRGYSNTREFVAPLQQPTVHVPVSNMVYYVDDTGVRIGTVERGQEAAQNSIVVLGGKEWVVVSGTLGNNANTIAVRQNLPQPIN